MATHPTLIRRFACPYYKMHGQLGIKGESCTGKGYPTAHRTKKHLYRIHGPPVSCPRCYTGFLDQKEVNSHLRSELICDLMSPPVNDQTNTFTEAKKLELKLRSPARNGDTDEVGKCKEIYRILFPEAPIPNSLYVIEEGSPSRLELQAELETVLRELLFNKIPRKAKYSGLDGQLKNFIETAHTTGFLEEAANLIDHRHKKRRVSLEQSYVPSDELSSSTGDLMESNAIANSAPLNTTTVDRFDFSQSSEKLPSLLWNDCVPSSWSADSLEGLDSTLFQSFDLDPWGQTTYGTFTGSAGDLPED